MSHSAPPSPAASPHPASAFTPAQRTLLEALAAGASKSDAARAAHVHRDTANHWEHSVPGFHEAVLAAQQEYRLSLLNQLRRVSATALDQLESLLGAPDTPPSVRLRAIQLALNRPRFPDKEWALPENVNAPEIQELQHQFESFEAQYRASLQEARLRREQAQSRRTDSQPAYGQRPSAPAPAPSPATPSPATPSPATPSPATPPRSAESFSAESAGSVGSVGNVGSVPFAPSPASPPQIARNAPCPCKSGLKFKRCCGKSAPPRLHQKTVA